MSIKDLLLQFTEMSKDIFGSNLTGIYLHGSYSLGCFNPKKSDLDLLLVVEDDVSDEQKMAFMRNVVKMNEEAPTKGIELSILKKEFCNPFHYPTPFELHFSVKHLNWFQANPQEYITKMKGTDKDLAAHITIINQNAVVLYGAAVKDVFENVPKLHYVDSILSDIHEAKVDILTDPMYVILTLCRVLGYLKDNLILSKQTGGVWGLINLPQEFHELIQEALICYQTDSDMAADTKIANKYVEFMVGNIDKRKAMLEKITEIINDD